MAENKTKKTAKSVYDFLKSIEDPIKQKDCFILLEIMEKITENEPEMWGDAIIGFGDWHYKYESGREGDCPPIGFSPRKQSITLYFLFGLDKYKDLLTSLGKYKIGKVCLYIKKLDDIDIKVLKDLIIESYKDIKNKEHGLQK